MWQVLQRVAIKAFELCGPVSAGLREVYARRRDLVLRRLAALGVDVFEPRGTIYVWMPVPGGEPSVAFAERLLREAAVVVGAGAAYGPAGEGYVRLSLTVPEERLDEAMDRLARVLGS
jgi:LL-diaminopimelate aminotransferase